MSTRTGGKDTALFEHNRQEASKLVNIQWADFTFLRFNTLDENGKVKYTGHIDIKNNVDDECSCDSFFYGMKFSKISEQSERIESRYVAEHGTAFQCKHIIKAKEIRKSRSTALLSKIETKKRVIYR